MTHRENQHGIQLNWFNLSYLIIALGGIFLRWIDLDARPVHHDESLHAMFGRYFYDFPDHNFYKYSPMMHGPIIYNVLRFVYLSLGCSTWSARALTALLGSALVFAPLLFRRFLTREALLGLTAAISLSPTLIYWSRFIREDTLQLFSMLLTLIGVVLARGGQKAFVVLLGITLQFCIKENSFVSAAIMVGYLIFEWGFNLLVSKTRESMLQEIVVYVKRYWQHLLLAFGSCAFLYSYLYSSGFRHAAGILDGLGRESIGYWWHHHDIERISGPFLFHFYMFSWYEFLFTCAYLFYLFTFYRKAGRHFQIVGGVVALVTVACAFSYLGKPVETLEPWKSFKVKSVLDMIGFFVFLSHALMVTIYHLHHRERVLAFWGYFFAANLFTYSYLGEKVPWLAVYPFVPGLVYFALYFDDYCRRRYSEAKPYTWDQVFIFVGTVVCICGLIFMVEDKNLGGGPQNNWMYLLIGAIFYTFGYAESYLKICGRLDLKILVLVAACIFNVRQAILTNFVYAGHASQYISQVHTTPEFHQWALEVKKQIRVPLVGKKVGVFGEGEVTWPITWYMIDTPEYKFIANEEEKKQFDYIFTDWKENGPPPPAGYRALRISLRGWWLPDFDHMTFKRFLNYSMNLIPWNDTGFTWCTVLVKE